RVAEVLQRQWVREELRGVVLDVEARLEGRVDHPVDRKDHHGEDEQAEQVDPDPAGDLPPAAAAPRGWQALELGLAHAEHRSPGERRAHCTSPIRTICRM